MEQCLACFRACDEGLTNTISRTCLEEVLVDIGICRTTAAALVQQHSFTCKALNDAFVDYELWLRHIFDSEQCEESLLDLKMDQNTLQGTYVILFSIPGLGTGIYDIIEYTPVDVGKSYCRGLTSDPSEVHVEGLRVLTSGMSEYQNLYPPWRLQPDGSMTLGGNTQLPIADLQLRSITYMLVDPQSSSVSSPFSSMSGELMDVIASGSVRLLRGRYLEDLWAQRHCVQRLQDLPEDAFWSPVEAASMWASYGSAFFLTLSYAWITAAHPDPTMYHLERVARIIFEWRAMMPAMCAFEKMVHANVPSTCPEDVGLFWDFCSLPQDDLAQGIKRTPEEFDAFRKGLSAVDLLYGHQRTTVFRSAGVPPEVLRKYHERGWPLFEVAVSDTKPSAHMKVFEFNSDFDIKTCKRGFSFFFPAIQEQNVPVCPEHFVRELTSRGQRMKARGLKLFTNGKDNSFVVEKYSNLWSQLCKSTMVKYECCQWSPEQIQELCSVLNNFEQLNTIRLGNITLHSQCMTTFSQTLSAKTQIVALKLDNCGIGADGAKVLAQALPCLASLQTLSIHFNPLQDEGVSAIIKSVQASSKLVVIAMAGVGLSDLGFEVFPACIKILSNLKVLWLPFNRAGTHGAAALAHSFEGTSLHNLNVLTTTLCDADKDKLLRNWIAAGKPKEGLLM